MGRLTASLLAFSAAAVLAAALSACGGSDAELLPGRTANEIEANLDEVARLAREGECVGAEDAAQQVSSDIDSLGDVDAKLKQALREGAARLNEVVVNCVEEEPEEEVESFEPEEEELEPAEEAEKPEKKQKPEKAEKPEKEEPETEAPEEEANPELPPQSNGKGKGLENGQGPPEGGTPSGGVGPSTAVEGE